DVLRFLFANFGVLYSSDGKSAQFLTQMAPGIQIPVFPVVNQGLRADVAPGFGAFVIHVVNMQLAFFEQTFADAVEDFSRQLAVGNGQNANMVGKGAGGNVASLEQFGDFFFNNGEFVVKQTIAEAFQQVEQQAQGLQFFAGKPEAGKFKTVVGVVYIVPAAPGLIVLDGGFENVVHGFNDAVNIALTAFQFVGKGTQRNRQAAAGEYGVELLNAVKICHGIVFLFADCLVI